MPLSTPNYSEEKETCNKPQTKVGRQIYGNPCTTAISFNYYIVITHSARKWKKLKIK